jgi:hypothetical protein
MQYFQDYITIFVSLTIAPRHYLTFPKFKLHEPKHGGPV